MLAESYFIQPLTQVMSSHCNQWYNNQHRYPNNRLTQKYFY
ncbi:MAG TPA: hypothetical protein DIW54_07890 [Chitinophagaceae bacterium]|nr:hypothetical protein [Chitinophagaceae bacterium]